MTRNNDRPPARLKQDRQIPRRTGNFGTPLNAFIHSNGWVTSLPGVAFAAGGGLSPIPSRLSAK